MFKQAFLIGQMLDGKIPDVYLQSSKYWEKHKQQVRDYFRAGIGEPIDAVAIHFRRGDYMKAEHFHKNLMETDYYDMAIRMFPNQLFYIFCRDRQDPHQDEADMEWATEYMKSKNVRWEFHRNKTEVDDLNMMASCKSLIMANSSFSWWAAFLGDHERVICPREWFVDKKERIEIMPEWICL